MTWTVILRKSKKPAWLLLALLIWFGAGYLGYMAFPSKMSVEWGQLERMFSRVGSWNSYYVDERVLGDGLTLAEVKGRINHEPRLGQFQIHALLRENEYFHLEAFLENEQIYIHNLQEGNWVQMSSNHPTAGELTAVSQPMEFWKILLTYVKRIKHENENDLAYYRMELRPFAETEHGMTFEGQEGVLSVWSDQATGNLQKLQLEIESPQNTLKSYNKVSYTVVFSNINEKFHLEIPSAARQAEKLK